MPKMHCMGTSLEIPSSGYICRRLQTNIVPEGMRCQVSCTSGTPNVEMIKCEPDGWPIEEVYCSGTSAGLIVGLLVGGIIVVCLIAYGYAKWKAYKIKKEGGPTTEAGVKDQPVTRAAKIAARNDMMVTGVVSRAAIKSGVVQQVPTEPTGKLVTGDPEDYDYRHQSVSNQYSNPPPSYHSTEQSEDHGRNLTTSSKSRSKRSRKSTGDHPQPQRKHRAYYDEYTEEVDLGYHEGSAQPTLEGQFYSVQNNGPMVSDYYRPSNTRSNQRYGATDHDYYARDVGPYPDHYLNGVDDVGYGYSHHEKPYHVPI